EALAEVFAHSEYPQRQAAGAGCLRLSANHEVSDARRIRLQRRAVVACIAEQRTARKDAGRLSKPPLGAHLERPMLRVGGRIHPPAARGLDNNVAVSCERFAGDAPGPRTGLSARARRDFSLVLR